MKPFLIYPLSDLPFTKEERAARIYWHLDLKISLTYPVSESLCRLRERAFVISDLILEPGFHSPDCYDEWLEGR